MKISKYTLYELIKRGDIPAKRVGRHLRIDYDSLMNYLKAAPIPKSVQKPEIDNFTQSNPAGLQFVGSHDPVIELLCDFLHYSSSPITLSTNFKGSMEGLIALYQRKADFTGIHLWDEKTKDYNLPFIKYLLPNESLTVVNLVQRVQGWIVTEGNPLQLKSWEDITNKDIRFINRQKGSGTRLRLDQYLMEQGIPPIQIQGYDKEETTHLGVAIKIARGEGNAGIGIQAAAQKMGLDFVSLFTERYDLVILREKENKAEWAKLMEILQSPAFHKAIEQNAGYDASLTGQIICRT